MLLGGWSKQIGQNIFNNANFWDIDERSLLKFAFGEKIDVACIEDSIDECSSHYEVFYLLYDYASFVDVQDASSDDNTLVGDSIEDSLPPDELHQEWNE